MKYNPDINRYRGVDARLLGQMLGSDSPINCGYESTLDSCGCTNSRTTGKNTRLSAGNNGCGNGCADHDGHVDDAMLASACKGNASLAMVYSPYQHFHMLYSANEALSRGTMFRELDKPWKAGGMR